MNYKESKVYLEQVSKYGSVLGLDNMKEMLKRLGNPQDDLKFIHISGTNGKGSVLAFVSTVLRHAGYRVGRYVSPTLFSYEERIQIGEVPIEKETLARLLTALAGTIEEMVADGKTHPTVFEIETALGFLYFKEQGCDFVVLETGLGGLLDATNVIQTSIMEIITSISRDHMGFLGDTLKEIAFQKAGIIKKHTMVVTCMQEAEAMEVIEETCRQKQCRLRIADADRAKEVCYGIRKQSFSYGRWKQIKISLAGVHQITNAVLSLEAMDGLRELGIKVPKEAVYEGMAQTVWRGRLTVLADAPTVIIDGAHNEAAAKVLSDSLRMYFPGRKFRYIMGVFADKEYEKIIRLMLPLAEHVTAIETPDNVRALPKEELARAISSYPAEVECAQSIEEAVQKEWRRANAKDVIVAFGSLSFLGDLALEVEKEKGKDDGIR